MRNMDAGQITASQKTEATEPIVGLKVNWRAASVSRVYATKDSGGWEGRILEFSGITQRKQNNEIGTVSSASLRLSDHDGHLKFIIDGTDIEGTPVELLHFFSGEAGNPTEIFRGRISNPRWSEGERVLDIEIVSEIESNAVGYAVKEGEFSANNDVAIATWLRRIVRATTTPAAAWTIKSTTEHSTSLARTANSMFSTKSSTPGWTKQSSSRD